jgi:hypothetical protein
VSDPDNVADSPSHSFGELATPLRTLDSTRSARGRITVDQAQIYLGEAMRKIVLATGDVRLPLGWVLSEHSRNAIECSFGIADYCVEETYLKDPKSLDARQHNEQVIEQIGVDLRK